MFSTALLVFLYKILLEFDRKWPRYVQKAIYIIQIKLKCVYVRPVCLSVCVFVCLSVCFVWENRWIVLHNSLWRLKGKFRGVSGKHQKIISPCLK